MALYDVRCETHGEVEIWAPMKDAAEGNLFCCQCGTKAVRIYKPGVSDHSENTFKPWYSDQLTLGNDPVYIKSRAEERGMMGNMGLQRWEPGMKSEAAKCAEQNRRRKERAAREARG